jgi:methionyl-tRNA synthetase
VGWGYDETLYKKWWPADLHVIGKDIIRFHAVYWPAMLLSAKLQLPKALLVHGFITSGGKKMSKSIGNVIDPYALIEKFGVETFRYYLLSQIPTQDDGDLTEERMAAVYTSDLQNGLGNLVARVSTLCEKYALNLNIVNTNVPNALVEDIAPYMKSYQFDQALRIIWQNIASLDGYMSKERPWQQELSDGKKVLSNIVLGMEGIRGIRDIAEALRPFMPQTAEKILKQFGGEKIVKGESLFPRL